MDRIKIKRFKTVVALFAAAVTPTLLFFVIYLWQVISQGDIFNLSWVVFFSKFTFVVATAHLLIFGVPAFVLGRYFNAIHWWSTLIVAFIIGATPAMFVLWPGQPLDSVFRLAAIMGIFGVCGGMAFWLLWRYWVQSDSLHGN